MRPRSFIDRHLFIFFPSRRFRSCWVIMWNSYFYFRRTFGFSSDEFSWLLLIWDRWILFCGFDKVNMIVRPFNLFFVNHIWFFILGYTKDLKIRCFYQIIIRALYVFKKKIILKIQRDMNLGYKLINQMKLTCRKIWLRINKM